jgi:hypothetical protein
MSTDANRCFEILTYGVLIVGKWRFLINMNHNQRWISANKQQAFALSKSMCAHSTKLRMRNGLLLLAGWSVAWSHSCFFEKHQIVFMNRKVVCSHKLKYRFICKKFLTRNEDNLVTRLAILVWIAWILIRSRGITRIILRRWRILIHRIRLRS